MSSVVVPLRAGRFVWASIETGAPYRRISKLLKRQKTGEVIDRPLGYAHRDIYALVEPAQDVAVDSGACDAATTLPSRCETVIDSAADQGK